MERIVLVLATIGLAMSTVGVGAEPTGLGARDTMQLVVTRLDNSESRVAIEVRNYEPLTGLDIPLRYGQPSDSIILDHVEWSSRVAGWEVKTAQIDNEAKTVILGLISELQTVRANADLPAATAGHSAIAELIFKAVGEVAPVIDTFTTDYPRHKLMFFNNRYEKGQPLVQELHPEFVLRKDE